MVRYSRGAVVGADAVSAFYGLRYTLTAAESDAVERGVDYRVNAARQCKLHIRTGRLTDGQPEFLLIGTRLGVFGVQDQASLSLSIPELDGLVTVTNERLRSAGLEGTPQLHLQLEAQY
jgi:hypothetical protein